MAVAGAGYGSESADDLPRHSIITEPLLPLFNMFVVDYAYRFSERHELITGLMYAKETTTPSKYLAYPGEIITFAAIAGYRFYIWRGFHVEYQLIPGYKRYYESTSGTQTQSFTLYNEFRVGYVFEFKLWNVPFLINLQWPLGFSLYDSNEPESFAEVSRQDPVFYIPYPNLFLGIKF